MGGPPGNRPAVPRDWFRGVPERYVAGADTRGRPEGRPYPGSQQAIYQTSGLLLAMGFSARYNAKVIFVLII
jgi:hypothetical protein